jgi:uncharacterized integral membrane protein
LATVRKTVLFLAILFAVLIMAVFAYNNPDRIAVDLGVVRIEGVPVSIAFVVCLALGWVFGLISAGIALLRMSGERRRLRRDLRLAEAEVKSLRSLPLHDAD